MKFNIGILKDLTLKTRNFLSETHVNTLEYTLIQSYSFIEHTVKKLNQLSGMIYKVRETYPTKCLLMFYNSFAKSIISYGILTFGSRAKDHLYKIKNAQRRILRAIFSRSMVVLDMNLNGTKL